VSPDELSQRLSGISTRWTLVFQAHAGQADEATGARHRLLLRYSGAAFRYLLGAVRDADAAAELCQEFALRLVRGDFHAAQPERGRFRRYLRTALVHLVNDFHRARRRWPGSLPAGCEPAAPAEEEAEDAAFLASWRDDLLNRTWDALARFNAVYHAVLRFRIDNPDAASPRMAQELSARLGQPLTAPAVRKALQRAHEKFSGLLIEEVEASLEGATAEELREELERIDLLRFCRAALERRGGA
jgi:RNA polymerase sigma-70 factor (ECF subfamily)